MSGGIIITPEVSWIKAGWLAELVSECIKTHLQDASALERMRAIGLYPGSLADFSSAHMDEMRALYDATLAAAAELRGNGLERLGEAYPAVVGRLDELIKLLERDARVTQE
jgi:hypothetical protein